MAEEDRLGYLKPNLDLSLEDRALFVINRITKLSKVNGPDTLALQGVKLTSASPGRTEWELTIESKHCNSANNLHGGCSATILDCLTSTTLVTMARPGYLENGHVSRTITMSYLRPVPNGTKVKIDCQFIAAGRTTANVQGQIKTMDGKVCVTCVHDKALLPIPTPKL